MKEAVIVSATRTAVGRAKRGTLVNHRPDEMAATAIGEVLRRANGVEPEMVEDVILGCSFPEAEQGMNVGRIAALRAGLPYTVAGETVNRFCASGLQSIALASERIMLGTSRCIIAGGTESMSMVPMGGNKYSPNPWLMENYPEAYTIMGMTAEHVAEEFNVSRDDQDEFSYHSHMKAIAAQDAGRFRDEIVPMEVEIETEEGRKTVLFDSDEGPRRGTTVEKIAALKPAFKEDGTVTPGNSSQMSDGAAAVMVMERGLAESAGLKPLVRFLGYAVAGVRPEVMGIGPVEAVPKLLKLTGFNLSDMDIVELNEAFAAQSLAVIREMGLDTGKLNMNGGAIALGHPLGCTGAKLTVQIIHEMLREGHRYGLVTMCIGGGMGAAGIFENLNVKGQGL
jgi:acetyl-CoA acyltransferase